MSANTQQAFRSQLSGFRWANSVQDDSAAAPSGSGAGAAGAGNNPFSRAWTGISGYIPLRNEGRSQEEEAYFALSVRLCSYVIYAERRELLDSVLACSQATGVLIGDLRMSSS